MGRPRRFDEQRLLDVAEQAFWTHGYDRTSIDAIASGSGVGNGSIYAAYESKLGLFLAVFSRYCEGRIALVDRTVRAHSGPFEDAVAAYLAAIVDECTGFGDRRGCLMLNSIADLGSRFPEVVRTGRATITGMEQSLAARVRRGVDEGELRLRPEQVDALGAHIVLVSQGLIQLSRVGMPDEHLRSVASVSSRMTALLAAA